MPKFRVLASIMFEIEAHDDDQAWEKLQELKFSEAAWDNVHEFEEIKDEVRH